MARGITAGRPGIWGCLVRNSSRFFGIPSYNEIRTDKNDNFKLPSIDMLVRSLTRLEQANVGLAVKNNDARSSGRKVMQ
eukprot:scaffold75043_cov48-Prasinocladus_malaysianus.AAC.1